MKYRIRLFLAVIALPVVAVTSWNAGHTAGLEDMAREYSRAEFGQLASGVLDFQLPVKKPVVKKGG